MGKFQRAYYEICGKEEANMIAQGLSGIAGFPWTLGVDAGVIPALYMPLYANLQNIFNRHSSHD
ncbi:MAG: hypothetical protein LBU32_23510 [Clostridiales bacterium]|jgi:hypothetical protein|nr:hypothetical protein [Clostridiales bacterium]